MGICRNENAAKENQDYYSERKRSNKKEAGQDPNFLDMYESGDNSYKDVGIEWKDINVICTINKMNSMQIFGWRKTKMKIRE